jgi:hypothetical protein
MLIRIVNNFRAPALARFPEASEDACSNVKEHAMKVAATAAGRAVPELASN